MYTNLDDNIRTICLFTNNPLYYTEYIYKKENEYNGIIIKTDGLRTFELSENNKIYIFTDQDKKFNLKIEGVLKDEKIKNIDFVCGEINDEICELSEISDWGQYIIIDC